MNRQYVAHQILLRAWPFPRGAGRIIDKLFSQLRFDEETATVTTTDGLLITVMPNELIGRHIYLTGEFDRTTAEVLIDFAEPGDLLADIGANIGYVSGCFLQNVTGSNAICVEPQPVVIDLLSLNMRAFGDRCSIAQVALSDHDGEGFFETHPRHLGIGKLTGYNGPGVTRVAVQSANRFFAKLDRLDLVKIDVEGHEKNIIKNAKTHLHRLQPRAIFFEDQERRSAPDGAIGSVLGAIGYALFGVKKYLTKIALVPITTRGDCLYNDYLAVSKSRPISSRVRLKYKIN